MSLRRTAALTGFALTTLVSAEAAAQQRFSAYEFFTAPPAHARAALIARNDRPLGPAVMSPVAMSRAVFGGRNSAVRRPVAHRGAQEVAGDVARARSEFERGINLAGRLQWAEAAQAFESSYRLAPRPSTLFNLGLAHRALGRYTRAIEELNQFLQQSANNPDLSAETTQAQQVVGEMQGELATLTIVPSVPNATITLDDRPVNANEPIRVDPTNHIVVATAPGYQRFARTITLSRQEQHQLDVRMDRAGGLSGGAIAGLVIGGVLVVGAGVTLGILAATVWSTEESPSCGTLNVCITPR